MSGKKVIAIVAAVLCVSTVAIYAVRATAGEKTKAKEEKTQDILVNTAAVKMQDINSTVDFVATLKASESVSVYPKLGGKVAKTYFEVGDKVNAGDVLFELDTTDYQTALDNAKAAQAVSIASYNKQTGSGLEQELLSLEMQRALAAINSDNAGDKIDDLLDQRADLRKKYNDALSALGKSAEAYQSDLITAKSLVDSLSTQYTQFKSDSDIVLNHPEKLQKAEADLNAATAKYESLKQGYEPYSAIDSQLKSVNLSLDVAYKSDDPLSAQQYYYYQQYDLAAGKGKTESEALAKAQLEQAMIGVASAQKQINDCRITAPISGVIQQKNVKTYEMSASSMASYVITVNNSLNVEFAVSDRYIKNIAVNDVIKVDTAAGVKDAKITEVSENADLKTGLFDIKAIIDNSNNQLRAGSAVTVTVTTQKARQSVTVPVKCVRYQNEEAFTYKFADGKAVRTVVTTGISDGTNIEITNGLTPDDIIITTWHPNLRDGVEVVQAQQ